MTDRVKRPYRSPLRQGQAASTRLAILRAAGRLFIEHGYVPTSIEAIAEAAGVSRATVFNSVGGKATILKAAYDIALVGDDAPVALPDRPESRAVMARTDPAAFLDGYAGIMTDVHGRLAPIYEAVRGAASADTDAREVWEKVVAERLGGARNVVAGVQARGGLREGLDPGAGRRRRLGAERPRALPLAGEPARLGPAGISRLAFRGAPVAAHARRRNRPPVRTANARRFTPQVNHPRTALSVTCKRLDAGSQVAGPRSQ